MFFVQIVPAWSIHVGFLAIQPPQETVFCFLLHREYTTHHLNKTLFDLWRIAFGCFCLDLFFSFSFSGVLESVAQTLDTGISRCWDCSDRDEHQQQPLPFDARISVSLALLVTPPETKPLVLVKKVKTVCISTMIITKLTIWMNIHLFYFWRDWDSSEMLTSPSAALLNLSKSCRIRRFVRLILSC